MYKPRMVHVYTYLSPTITLHCTDYHPCLVPRAFYLQFEGFFHLLVNMRNGVLLAPHSVCGCGKSHCPFLVHTCGCTLMPSETCLPGVHVFTTNATYRHCCRTNTHTAREANWLSYLTVATISKVKTLLIQSPASEKHTH